MTTKTKNSTFRLLIVDDEMHNIKVLAEILKGDYKIMAAKDGNSALKASHAEPPPDLILLDIIMDGMDGYEVCRKLKAKEKTKDIPVIFVTAISEAMDAAKGFEVGAVDYVTKPFNPLTVKARVQTHLSLSSTLKDLKEALVDIKTLTGLLPICSHCKKIRDDKGYWSQIESYIHEHSDAEFSHSICPECADKYYPEMDLYKNAK